MRTDNKRQFDWSGRMELLEDRLPMSADPLGDLLGGSIQHHVTIEEPPHLEHHLQAALEDASALDHHLQSMPDFWIDPDRDAALGDIYHEIDQTLSDAHDQTGMTQVSQNYGFTGAGQTVAVIDSGIAYDHFALGGGFGSNYRVVGGWDFTVENDPDPYDDGPSGKHGTHVAGIIGGDAGNDSGVAPGADLVALRVFDDAGNGYFSWVENALSWIHDNRNSFDNPITAVNLSLGVATWNSDSIPAWANIEEEFSQLKADGIFISVSAGNSYPTFENTGLSYPAASPHVVPVMSVNNSGLLAYYSQRHSSAIAVPGSGIYSTIPDYAGNNNGTTDDFRYLSGTSMAAPYVAGASVIIREAMEFVGYSNITQDTIYNHMIATSDSFFDPETNASYNRLNVGAAIDSLMPLDDYGSSIATAYDLGTVGDTTTIVNGIIGKMDDSDYFTFTADESGTVDFTGSSNEGTFTWDTSAIASATENGDTVSFDVVEGQSYTLGLAPNGSVLHYGLQIEYSDVTASTPTSAIAVAYQLDQQLGLSYSGHYYEDWGGINEKWIRASNGTWHFITPDGTVYEWSGGNVPDSSAIATLSASHYAHAELLHDAPSFGQPQDDLLADLDGTLGLQYPGNYFENSGGLGEKWIISDSGQWYFITPVGDIYEWVAGQSMGDGALLAQLDSSVHASPDTLHDASASNLTLPELAYQLDQDLGLEFSSSYFEDWAGWSEKWIQSQSGNWHFITPDGSFYRFTTQASLASNILIATFDSTYHSDPSALHDAPTPSAMQLVFDETGDGQLSTSVYSNAWLATEDSSTLRDTSVNTFHVDIQSLAQDVIATEQHLSELAFSALANGQTANDFGALTSDENALEDATEGSFIDRIAGEIDESAIDQLFGRLVAWS